MEGLPGWGISSMPGSPPTAFTHIYGRIKGRITVHGRTFKRMDKPFDGDGDGDQEVPVGRSRTRKIRRPLSPGRGLDDVPIRKARGRAVERAGLRQTSSRLPGQSDDTDSLHRCMAEMNISTGSEKSSKQLQEISQKKSIELPVPLNDKEVKSKKGTSGRPVCLNANYFRLETVSKWQLYQYRVDFEPEEDRKMVQSYLLREHKETLRGYLFDGTMLFSPYKYDSNPLILFSDKPSDKTRVRIMIREVGYLAFEDKQYVNIFNILLRRCLHSLHLQLVGRYYFDSSARIAVDNHRLELWPGYVTSIRQHETDLLLCTEITHKVMRQDTVHTLLKDCYKSKSSNYQTLFKQTILGAIVLTEYNNKTYRIDDVDFSVTPASTFECKGNDVSYISYYAKKYDLHINDPGQPMLVTMPKKRDRQQGEPSPIYLVPELCKMTGLSDQMRSNFKLMRSLADHTRLDPSQRMDRLQHFNRRLHTNSLVTS
ncbi:hypothetical protein ANN_07991 [Periplaneta americana]|uniref:PAZ domain-containing protein n=1 Tax=Periplaneta americana TaxID=6978 RepID=A0ABQ8T1J7_PERAM|nr:hypothetical protein ANN_07991 [Periplaneta americana]